MARAEPAVPRPSRRAIGAGAERLAEEFLTNQGLIVLARNFNTRHGEIDLILHDGATLVFAEVRLRSNRNFGGAAASITPAKQGRLRLAARVYLARLSHEPPCRFDAILLDGLDPARITWERDIMDG